MKNEDRSALNDDAEKALAYAVAVVSRWVEGNGTRRGIYIPALDENLRDVNALFTPVWEATSLSFEGSSLFAGERLSLARPEFRGYRVTEYGAEKIFSAFKESPRAAKAIVDNIALNVGLGMEMPRPLRVLASALLRGGIEMPKPGRGRPSEAHRNALLVGIARRICTATGIAQGANYSAFEGSEGPPVCGCTLAAAAMYGFGINIVPRQAAEVIYRQTHDALENHQEVLLPEKSRLGFSLFRDLDPLDADASAHEAELGKAREYFRPV